MGKTSWLALIRDDQTNGAYELRQAVLDQLNQTAGSLCNQAGRDIEDVADVVLVGNTAMHHLVLGLPVSQLGLAPYIPAEYDAINIRAKFGLSLPRVLIPCLILQVLLARIMWLCYWVRKCLKTKASY